MKEIKISANQLATFPEGTEAKKKSIIRQQKTPSPIIVARYAKARSRMKKTYSDKGNIKHVVDGIEELKKIIPETDWKRNDKMVSIEALTRFLRMELPVFLEDVPYEVLSKPKISYIIVKGVKIIVSPDIIVRIKIDGKYYLGAIKIRIAKSSLFTTKQSRRIATMIHKYLEDAVANEEDVVSKEMCVALDVFHNSTITAPRKMKRIFSEIENSCEEIKALWSVA